MPNDVTKLDYEKLVELLDRLIDQVGEDESHPLESMMDIIGVRSFTIRSLQDSLGWSINQQVHRVDIQNIAVLRP